MFHRHVTGPRDRRTGNERRCRVFAHLLAAGVGLFAVGRWTTSTATIPWSTASLKYTTTWRHFDDTSASATASFSNVLGAPVCDQSGIDIRSHKRRFPAPRLEPFGNLHGLLNTRPHDVTSMFPVTPFRIPFSVEELQHQQQQKRVVGSDGGLLVGAEHRTALILSERWRLCVYYSSRRADLPDEARLPVGFQSAAPRPSHRPRPSVNQSINPFICQSSPPHLHPHLWQTLQPPVAEPQTSSKRWAPGQESLHSLVNSYHYFMIKILKQ